MPLGLPDAVYATWVSSLTDINNTDNARHAAERYQFLCGFSQGLVDSGVIDQTGYADLRAKLLETWARAVNRIDQSLTGVSR